MIVKSATFIAPRARKKCASDISVITSPLSGILVLATMLHKKGFDVQFFDESYKIPDYEKIDSDYIFITSMSATATRAYELADFFKEKGKKVVLGGLHVTFKQEEALQHCDKVVLGEGENVILDLINDKFKKNVIQGSPVLDMDSHSNARL